jgi:hypothetical protein
MTIADVLSWFLLVSGTYVALVSVWLAAGALVPATVERCSELCARPVRVTLVGLVLGLPLLVIGAAVAGRGRHAPALGALGVGLLMLFFLPAVFGLAGLARRIGAGLGSPADGAQPGCLTLRGGAVLAATFLLPFGGWFLLLPWALVSGFGATVMAWWSRDRA